jgi:hypothetical protein
MPTRTATPGSTPLRAPGRAAAVLAHRFVALAVTLAIVVTGCSAAGVPPAGTPGNPASESPTASPTGSPGASAGSVGSAQEAIAAVGRFDSNFLGYTQRDPDLIGQSAWVEVEPVANGFELVFFRGEGDCPAGCIERSFIKFFVGGDGQVEKRCEWHEGEGADSTPC